MLEAECQRIDVAVVVTGSSLNELWRFGDNGILGLQRHAYVNLISALSTVYGGGSHTAGTLLGMFDDLDVVDLGVFINIKSGDIIVTLGAV